MASIRRKNGSQFWYACFTTPDGKRTQRSTETTDRKLAQRLAEEFEETAAKKRTEAQVRQIMSDLHERIHGSPIASAALDAYYRQWITRKQGEVSKTSFAAYKYAVREFIEFIAEKAARPIQYIAPHDIARWRDAVAAKSSATTANNKLKIVRVFFESAWRENLILENPAQKVCVLKTSPTVRRPFTIKELQSVLHAAAGEWKGMVLFGAYTGQRLKDIASLTSASVDLERREVKLVTSKTQRSQVIPLHPTLQRHLEEQKHTRAFAEPLFPIAYQIAVTKCDVSPLSQQFHHILVRAGLAKPRPPHGKSKGVGRQSPRERNSLSFHSLRHTATTWLKDAGVSESVARDIIGHDSAEISRLYTHTGDAAKRAAVDTLPDLQLRSPKTKLFKRLPNGHHVVHVRKRNSDAA